MSRPGTVKNRAPAQIQITAEQILREAKDRTTDGIATAPKQHITDQAELDDFRMRKRKEFEDKIRMQRQHMGNWTKYAQFEESQRDFTRARSVFERALDVDARNQSLWLKYAEMEMRNKFVNHARNVWDRAVGLLPRVDQFWYKYAYMEEMLGDIAKARGVFERWTKWEPDDHAWTSYAKLEKRAGHVERARAIFERYMDCHPTLRAYLKYARWEDKEGDRANARSVFERAMNELPDEEQLPKLFVQFAHYEERMHETERARVIYKYALDNIPKEEAQDVYKEFVAFEKKHGDREGIENVIVGKRRMQYEESLKENPTDYDVWFDFVRLEEAEARECPDTTPENEKHARVREVYERAISNIPPVAEKRYWRRYIYLWINYALYEELDARDAERTRAVYKACLGVIPHNHFTFAKIWVMLAHFEVRQSNFTGARKALGQAIGRCAKEKVFKEYIHMELQLGEVNRVRTLYEKYLEHAPHNCSAWQKFAELEDELDEPARCRAIFELSINQQQLDMPEMLWKSYIDFEIRRDDGDGERVRRLYERLLERTSHVKVWISFAKWEGSRGTDDEVNITARGVFERAYNYLKNAELKEERVMLLNEWKQFEQNLGDTNTNNINEVNSKMPRQIKKRRPVTGDDGAAGGWEEYVDYVFPDDEKAASGLKLMERARLWKLQRQQAAAAEAAAAAGGGSETSTSSKKRKAEGEPDADGGDNV